MISTIPRIAHLPGSQVGVGDLVLSPAEARPFFTRRVVVCEKLDGISLTVRRDAFGELAAALKAEWKHALGGRIQRAADLWVQLHRSALEPLVQGTTQLYGEWLWHRLRVSYDRLPSEVSFYGLRRGHGALLPFDEVRRRLAPSGLTMSEPLFEGVLGARRLEGLVRRAAWGAGRAEGVIVELDTGEGVRWAKWVRASYRQPVPQALSGVKNRLQSLRHGR
ncbi:MAG: hypothetical protein JNK82_34405 [Myxococcaceae bacterium]|nr:hypothetical protein [Myxococcaceae bacterium]